MTFDDDNRNATFNGSNVIYDSDGNMTSGPLTNSTLTNYTYDARNRLLSAGGLSFGYDPAGNRVAVTNGTNVTRFVVNPNAPLSQVLLRVKNGVTNYYVYGLGLLYEIDATGNTKTYHFDYRGSTVAMTDGNGNVTDRAEYSAYGSLTYRTGTNDIPFWFNGRYGVQTDPNGLLYMRARYYNSYLCRFLNPDPAGFAGGVNFYAFADGNPISYLDPFGLFSWSWSGAAMGATKAVIGVAVGVAIGAAVVATAPVSVVVAAGVITAGVGGFTTGQSIYEGTSGQEWTASGNGAQLSDFARSESIGNAAVGTASLAVLGSQWGRAGADKDLAWLKMSPQQRMAYDQDLMMASDITNQSSDGG